ncbi:MAG: putative methyltransferase [Microbacteriaceae bacterium]|nr:putative methyltransferase [Microbacteriaceae bacterium]
MTTPLFLQPGLGAPFWILFSAFVVGELVLAVRSRLNRGGQRVRGWGQLTTVVGIDGSILAGLAFGVRGVGPLPLPWIFFVAGLIAMLAGIVLRQWAIITLGRFFTDNVRVHSNQTVVDRGPYRWVRHPSYSGMLLFFAGLGLAMASWPALIVLVVVPTTVLVWRIRIEERALVTSAGDDYLKYAGRRKRLIPGVW